ncbi:8946_t:CDS:2, partial [Gigaspora rosea]
NKNFLKETRGHKEIKQLLRTKEDDIQQRRPRDGRCFTSSVEKRKASSAKQQELPHSISRSEVYKSVNFGIATTDELLLNPAIPLELPDKLHDYLIKKRRANKEKTHNKKFYLIF